MLIGAVADDITGASDLCLMLANSGLHTVQVMGVPAPGAALPKADAVVIALKSRTIPARQAVAMSVAAAQRLMDAGAAQILFKYCSTFDSTDAGNIGPVTEALLALTGADITIACPAFPANSRTVYMGHLFVGVQLLSDSPMKDHPLTPMTDANLMRVLSRQTALDVGLVTVQTIAQGAHAVQRAMATAAAKGTRILVVDTTTDADLMTVGVACKGMPLVTGGSGIALGLAANFITADKVALGAALTRMAAPAGRAVVLAGSCSVATLGQIAAAKAAGMPSFAIDVVALAEGRQTAAIIAKWVTAQPGPLPPLVYSSADPSSLAESQAMLGREASGALVEQTLARVAQLLQAAGFARFIIAGGETSGAVLDALDVHILNIGPQITPGVPWTRSIGAPDLALALKSGNFGDPDFFVKAWDLLEPEVLA
ncbi:MAG: four-carbon acid sugar kinase family protein [Rhodoferax sp.]|nr:four-carbon acid sugar kinase family protein [Pseudorhodobacter sp.]